MDIGDIFTSVKDSLDKETTGPALYKEKMKFEQGKDYLVRLVPYTKEGKEGLYKSIYHYIQYSWQDAEGGWHNVLSPRTYNERCPISDYSAKINRNGTKAEKDDKDSRLFYKSGYYVNAYVVDDPTTPSNNGKVKILPMGKALYNKLKAALDGDLDESWTEQYNNAADEDKQVDKIEVGKKVFDLSKNGVNLLIKVRKNQYGLNQYDESEFVLREAKLFKKDEDGKKVLLTDEERKAIEESTFDLTQVERVQSFEEISALFKKTYLGLDVEDEAPKKKSPVKTNPVVPSDDEDDEEEEVEDETEDEEVEDDTDVDVEDDTDEEEDEEENNIDEFLQKFKKKSKKDKK